MASIDDLNKKLDQAGEGSQPWIPEQEGDQIAGPVAARGSYTHPEYGTSPTLTIVTDPASVVVAGKPVKDAGTMRVSMFGAVLAGATEENDIRPGDWVAIRFLGVKKTRGGTTSYKNYAVIVEHPTATSKLDAAAGNEFA